MNAAVNAPYKKSYPSYHSLLRDKTPPFPLCRHAAAEWSMNMLTVEHLSFVYPDGSRALTDINFTLPKGSKTFFHGANGAGKTTLLQCINGLLKKSEGHIRIGGQALEKQRELMGATAIVFQNAADGIVAGSVFDEVAFGPLNMGLPEAEVRARVRHALEEMEIADLQNKPPHFLSYGQMKRVTIAAVLAMGQDILLLDEPTAGLDARQSAGLAAILNRLAAEGKTLLVSTHDADLSLTLADRVIVLEKGRLIADGTPEAVFASDAICEKGHLIRPLALDVFWALGGQKNSPAPKTRAELLKMISL